MNKLLPMIMIYGNKYYKNEKKMQYIPYDKNLPIIKMYKDFHSGKRKLTCSAKMKIRNINVDEKRQIMEYKMFIEGMTEGEAFQDVESEHPQIVIENYKSDEFTGRCYCGKIIFSVGDIAHFFRVYLEERAFNYCSNGKKQYQELRCVPTGRIYSIPQADVLYDSILEDYKKYKKMIDKELLTKYKNRNGKVKKI